MATWLEGWRNGIAPLMTHEGLVALREALRRDDRRLAQGVISLPIAVNDGDRAPVEAACAIGFCLWHGDGLDRVGRLKAQFARICATANDLLGAPCAVVAFLNWFDETPREQMRFQLLDEVERALGERMASAA